MSSSSDSDIELEQRSQAEVKTGSQTENKPKTPWDLMKSKSNKAFSKNYLKEMIEEPPRCTEVPSKLVFKHPVPNPCKEEKDEDDSNDHNDEAEHSSGISKKVSFSGTVRKREVSVGEESSDEETEEECHNDSPSKETSRDFEVKLSEPKDSDDEKLKNANQKKITKHNLDILSDRTKLKLNSSVGGTGRENLTEKNMNNSGANSKQHTLKKEKSPVSNSSKLSFGKNSPLINEKNISNKSTTINKYSIEESSSSNESSDKEINDVKNNYSLKKISKKSPKKDSVQTLSNSEDSTDDYSFNKVHRDKRASSSGDEFQTPKNSLSKSSLNGDPLFNKKSPLSKSPKSIQQTKINGALCKNLQKYSKLKCLEKITSETYNLSKDLKCSETEIYLVQVPKDIDPLFLADNVISFETPTSLDINDSTYVLNVNNDPNVSRILIAESNRHDNDDGYYKVTSVRPAGILSVSKEDKHRKESVKIHKMCTEENIQLPKDLKEHHLLLGPNYDLLKLDKFISDKLNGLITSFQKKHKSKKSKRKEEKLRHKEEEIANKDETENNLDIFKLFNEQSGKSSPNETDNGPAGKKKKKKRKSDEPEGNVTKQKSEMDESIDIINQIMLENEEQNREKQSRDDKKEKRHRSKSIFEETTPFVDETEVTTNQKKRKRAKSLSAESPERSFEESSSMLRKSKKSKIVLENVDDSEDLRKKHKKKGIVNSTMVSADLGNTSIFSDESLIPKLGKNATLNNFIDSLVKDVDDVKEKKKKKGKS